MQSAKQPVVLTTLETYVTIELSQTKMPLELQISLLVILFARRILPRLKIVVKNEREFSNMMTQRNLGLQKDMRCNRVI